MNTKREETILSKLSHDDIMGWFGHELAHIVEYETMSNSALLLFAFKYLCNLQFRFSVERRVNAFACNSGFVKELFGLWGTFLALDAVDKKYTVYIAENYPPEWKDVEQSALSYGVTETLFESFKKNNRIQ